MHVATFVAWALEVKCARSVRVKIAEEVLSEEIHQCDLIVLLVRFMSIGGRLFHKPRRRL